MGVNKLLDTNTDCIDTGRDARLARSRGYSTTAMPVMMKPCRRSVLSPGLLLPAVWPGGDRSRSVLSVLNAHHLLPSRRMFYSNVVGQFGQIHGLFICWLNESLLQSLHVTVVLLLYCLP